MSVFPEIIAQAISEYAWSYELVPEVKDHEINDFVLLNSRAGDFLYAHPHQYSWNEVDNIVHPLMKRQLMNVKTVTEWNRIFNISPHEFFVSIEQIRNSTCWPLLLSTFPGIFQSNEEAIYQELLKL